MLDVVHGTMTGRAILTPGPVLNAGERVALTPAQAADLMDRGLFRPDPVEATAVVVDVPSNTRMVTRPQSSSPNNKPVKGRV
jgi:hypothetical protein